MITSMQVHGITGHVIAVIDYFDDPENFVFVSVVDGSGKIVGPVTAEFVSVLGYMEQHKGTLESGGGLLFR